MPIEMGWQPNLLCSPLFINCECSIGKENAMFGAEVVLVLMFIRIVLPVGLVLWIGEWAKHKEKQY